MAGAGVSRTMATIKDVARLAGVSPSTASAAMNNSPKVRKEVAARIRQVALDLNYTPSASARALKRGNSTLLGLVVADLANPFYGAITKAIGQASRDAGYALILTDTDWDVMRERGYLDLMISHRVDGLIVAITGKESRQALQALRTTGVPVVMIDQAYPGLPFDAVTLDNDAAAQMGVDHIVSFGHRRIGLLVGPQALPTGEERLRGYRGALEAHGIAYDPALVAEAEYSVESGYAAAGRLLSLAEPPTAIFAGSDNITIGLMRYLADHGIACPDDLSVVCLDDFPMAGAVVPRLTAVAQPIQEMGRRAVAQLIERLTLPRTGEVARHTFQPALMVRESCAALKPRKPRRRALEARATAAAE